MKIPTFVVSKDEETGQTIIAGMGELHLEIIRDRMRLEFGVQSNAGQTADRLPGDHHECRTRGEFKIEPRPEVKPQYAHVIVKVASL